MLLNGNINKMCCGKISNLTVFYTTVGVCLGSKIHIRKTSTETFGGFLMDFSSVKSGLFPKI